ncbi:glycosyl transferase family 1 [Candidatus Falkowbacteria bacterium]|nr:MAG: glycosyl transferase family 1 [Candidatus Falkowbacteria bacterium]
MDIIFIGQKGIPATTGGIERHVDNLAVQLAEKGHNVHVYTRSNYTDKNLKKYKGVNLISLPSVSTKHLDAISHTFLACLDLIRRKADIIHFHSIGPSSLLWLAKLIKPNSKIIATFHSQCYYHQKWSLFARLYLKFGEYICCRFADKVITVSKTLKKYTKQKYKINSFYIPNGVYSQKYSTPKAIKKKWDFRKNSYIVLVSRLIRHKGIHYAIEAYNKIKTNKKLVIVGSGFHTDSYSDYLKSIAKNNKNIIFTGNQSGSTLRELFSNAYCFIQPSENEGLSIALLEAMSFGTPVLVSNIPENKEAIASTGYIFKNKDIGSLAKKLSFMLSNSAEVIRKGIEGKKRVEKFYNWNNITDEIVELYYESLKEKSLQIAKSYQKA